MPDKIIDHLFRHQFGKMVSILTKIYGFEHLETIEDAVQDTFIQAMRSWRNGTPENPEAWLTTAAKNRVIDIFRSVTAEKKRSHIQVKQMEFESLEYVFLDSEIEDSQLRMIFTACHPTLDPTEQIAFALKTMSGFSIKEIAAALLVKEETIKKRLQRARKMIAKEQLQFEIPVGTELPHRLDRVIEVIYVLFNEGFHSNKKDLVIRKDLCGEALRLCKMVLKKPKLRLPKVYALFALLCFHSARLDSRVNENNEVIPLSLQDRSKWYFPLIALGNDAMHKAVDESVVFSSFHYEAAIIAEHLRAPDFETTNWKTIAFLYEKLYQIQPTSQIQLSLAIVYLQSNEMDKAFEFLQRINQKDLAQKTHLFNATMAEYYHLSHNHENALLHISMALSKVPNQSEQKHLEARREEYIAKSLKN